MAGHSKFKNIMHRKGAQDKKRAKLFSRLIREISVSAKLGSPHPDSNPRLRSAINNALSSNMTKESIDKAIKKQTSTDDKDLIEEIIYEGFGPNGVAIIVEALTDNRNRTASNVRSLFVKYGGNLGETGSVSFMFDRLGVVVFQISVGDEEKMMELAIEVNALDVETENDTYSFFCNDKSLSVMTDDLEQKLGECELAKLIWKPKNYLSISSDQQNSLIKLIDSLENDDDVQNVYINTTLNT